MFSKKLFTLFVIALLALQSFAFPSLFDSDSESDSEEETVFGKLIVRSVKHEEFKNYGRIVEGYNLENILDALKKTSIPDSVTYVPEDESLMSTSDSDELGHGLYGGMPYQFGYCNGHNTKLNCLEYHRGSEFNLGTEEFILLLAKNTDIVDDKIDTSKVKAFKVPKGVLVEIYSTTLHYAPCHTDKSKGFQVLVALPKGTNVGKPKADGNGVEDKKLFATNKWLYAHKDASEVKDGAYVGITGENIDIADFI